MSGARYGVHVWVHTSLPMGLWCIDVMCSACRRCQREIEFDRGICPKRFPIISAQEHKSRHCLVGVPAIELWSTGGAWSEEQASQMGHGM